MGCGWLLIFIFSSFFVGLLLGNNNYCYSEDTNTNCSMHKIMKSIRHDTTNGTIELVTDTPVPSLTDGQVLVKVKAAGVNRLDLLQVRGLYPPPPGDSEILGVEVSGIIESMSPLAQSNCQYKVGDNVMALIGGGGYAEYAAVPYQCIMPLPHSIDFEKGAAIPEAFITAYQGLVWNANIQNGHTVLIHAGASSVGLAAIQLAKALRESTVVIATSRTADKLALCKENGADLVINSKVQNFADEVLKATNGKGADIILDFVGGAYYEQNMASIATDGHLILLGMLGGGTTPSSINLGLILKKRVTVRGTTLRSRSLQYKSQLIAEVNQNVVPLFTTGKCWAVIDKVYNIEKTEEAHQRMKDNLTRGKLILTL